MVIALLEQLKGLDEQTVNLESLVALAAFGRTLRAEYEQRQMSGPEWLDERLRSLNREIELRRRDVLELRLKEIRAQKTQFLSREERRTALEKEEAALEAVLNPPATIAPAVGS